MPEKPVSSAPRHARGIARPAWLALVVITAVLAAYANSFPGAFFLDDEGAILNNATIRNPADWRALLSPPVGAGIGGRPFANLTFALNHAISGYDPWSYRALNVLIHAASAALLCGITQRTLLAPVLRRRTGNSSANIAVVVALLWALHPVQTNVVDYCSQRTEGLMGALYLLTLYGFIRHAESRAIGWAAVAVAAAALGMATKEVMVTAPIMVLLYDRTFVSGSFGAAVRRHGWLHLALGGTWLVLGYLVVTSRLAERGVGFNLGVSGARYVLTESQAVMRYVQRAFWPAPLIFDYGPVFVRELRTAWPDAAGLAVLGGATAWALWRSPVIGFFGAWFFVVLAPTSSIVPIVQQPCAESRMYLPLAGAVALVAATAWRAARGRGLATLAFGAAACGAGTFARNPDFASELAIWWDTVAKSPRNARAENNLGNAFLKLRRTTEAQPHFEAALRLSPRYADARNNRGVSMLRLGNPVGALAEFRSALSDKSDYADAHYNLGEAYLQLGKDAEAIGELAAALRIQPDYAKAHNNMGMALLNVGRVDESIAQLRTALRLEPDMPEAHYNLGNSLARAGQTGEALREYGAALRYDPNFAKAHNNAGIILLHAGRIDEAAAHFKAALRIQPDYREARQNLALVRSRLHP